MRRIFAVVLPMVLAAGAVNAQSNDFRWSGTIPAGKSIEIRGVNGAIRAEPASGNQVEVVATKRHGGSDWDHGHGWRHDPSDLDSVKIEVVPNDGNVTICAVYPTQNPSVRWSPGRQQDVEPDECRPQSAGRTNTSNDVVVEFVVKVPAGVRLVAKTVNGAVDVRDLKSDAEIRTVNGKVFVSTSGTATAETVNGAIEATIGTASGTAPLDFHTVNGSVTLRLPKGTNAELHAATSNGHFESEFPITIQHFSGRQRHVDGTMGSGGRRIDLHTVNGSIRLQSAP